jgi:trk system potassium uptake protein TrkA
LVLERDGRRCEAIAEELGTSTVVQGDGCEAVTLEKAGTGRADIFVAVTGNDEDNLVACQVAKHKFSVAKTIARIKNPRNEAIFKKLGIDVTVSATDLILTHIEVELPLHPAIPLLQIKEGEFTLVKIKIPPDAIVVGKQIRELVLPEKSFITLIISEERGPQIPSGGTILRANDDVVAVTKPVHRESLQTILTTKPKRKE